MKLPDICEDCSNSIYFKEGSCWYYWKGKPECITGKNLKRGEGYATRQQDNFFNRTAEQDK